MRLHVITPEREVLNTDVESVILPGLVGEMEILPGHTYIASIFKNDVIRYVGNSGSNEISIDGGCAEVSNDIVTILTI